MTYSGCGSDSQSDVPPRPSEVLSPNALREDSSLVCIEHKLRQGVPPDRAYGECGESKASLRLVSNQSAGRFRNSSRLSGADQVGSVSCTSSGANPRIAKDILIPLAAPPNPREDGLLRKDPKYRALKQKAYKAYVHYQETEQSEDATDAEKAAAKKQWEDARDERNSYDPVVSERDSDGSDGDDELGDFPAPDSGGYAHPDPNSDESACAQATRFVMECNAHDWKTYECVALQRKMEGCSDLRITDPLPDAPSSCRQAADPEEAARITALICQRRTKPVPGEDPCAPVRVDAQILRAHMVGPSAGVDATPCGDPRAMPTEGQCATEITFVKIKRVDMREIIAKGRELFGGPVFVIPLPGPPKGPGPK